jgi:hypothetical protein
LLTIYPREKVDQLCTLFRREPAREHLVVRGDGCLGAIEYRPSSGRHPQRVHTPIFRSAGAPHPTESNETVRDRHDRGSIDITRIRERHLTESRIESDEREDAELPEGDVQRLKHLIERLKYSPVGAADPITHEGRELSKIDVVDLRACCYDIRRWLGWPATPAVSSKNCFGLVRTRGLCTLRASVANSLALFQVWHIDTRPATARMRLA